MVLREEDKHFLASLYIAIGIIFTWKGIWLALYKIPFIGDLRCPAFIGLENCAPSVFLFLGLTILIFSGLIFKEFDPFGGMQTGINKTLHNVQVHHQKELFQFKYHDKKMKKDIIIPAGWVKKIEKGALVIVPPKQKQEIFVPTHRLTEITYNGKSFWRM